LLRPRKGDATMSVSDLGSILIPCGHCSRMTSTQVLAGYEDRREEVVHTDTKDPAMNNIGDIRPCTQR